MILPNPANNLKISDVMNTKIYQQIAMRGVITEREINLCKNRANRGHDVWGVFDSRNEYALKITDEQTAKGLAWLLDKWKTPKGRVRKHNPFDQRQQAILKHFKEFKLIDFRDCSRGFYEWYLPVYRVISEHGRSFDYCANYASKECPITFLY